LKAIEIFQLVAGRKEDGSVVGASGQGSLTICKWDESSIRAAEM